MSPLWEIAGIAITLLLAWSALLIGAVKWLLDRYHAALDLRFEALEQARSEDSKQYHRLERDFLLLRAELPRDYIRREDHIRFETLINAKLDVLASKLESINVRMTHAN